MLGSQYKKVINENYQGQLLSQEKLEEIQKCLVSLLREIVDVCDKYDIKPFVIGGNLLGKVRHGGFIPWDDDLDLGMLRKDYVKFVAIFDKELSDRYVISAPVGNYKASNRFVQIGRKGTKRISGFNETYSENEPTCHIYIDIFPIDFFSNNALVRNLKALYCNSLMAIAGASSFRETSAEVRKLFKNSLRGKLELLARDVLGFIFSFRSTSAWMHCVDNAVKCDVPSKYCGLAVGRNHYLGDMIETEAYLPLMKSEYCGVQLYEINNPDMYLKQSYGDYMQVPPPEKRESHHAVAIELL